MNTNYKIESTTHMLTNDVIWLVDDISLVLAGVSSLVENFINRYQHDDYTLSIYDNLTSQTIDIDCSNKDIPQIVEYLYHLEKATPLTFIAINSLCNSYVVGMSICQGTIEFSAYTFKSGKLTKINSTNL